MLLFSIYFSFSDLSQHMGLKTPFLQFLVKKKRKKKCPTFKGLCHFSYCFEHQRIIIVKKKFKFRVGKGLRQLVFRRQHHIQTYHLLLWRICDWKLLNIPEQHVEKKAILYNKGRKANNTPVVCRTHKRNRTELFLFVYTITE